MIKAIPIMKTTYALIGIIAAGLVGAGLASTSLTTPLFLAPIQASYVETSPMTGHITVIAYDANGNIKSYIQSDNTIVNVGENCIAEVLFDLASANTTMLCAGGGSSAGGHGPNAQGFTFIGIGTSATGPTVDDTALGTEVETREDAGAQPGITMTDAENQAAGAVVTIVDTFTMGSGATIEEYGLFDASSGGNMFARQTPGGTTLSASDTLQVTWTINVGS